MRACWRTTCTPGKAFPYPVFSTVVRETVAWMDGWLSDRQNGGFYGSQDADMTLDDDGDYFTWTRAEAAEVLSADELDVAGAYYDIGELGDMHHNPAKNVLHINKPLGDAGEGAESRSGGSDRSDCECAREACRGACCAAHALHRSHDVHGLECDGHLRIPEASAVLKTAGARDFAIRTLDRILREAWSDEDGLAHVVAYSDGAAAAREFPACWMTMRCWCTRASTHGSGHWSRAITKRLRCWRPACSATSMTRRAGAFSIQRRGKRDWRADDAAQAVAGHADTRRETRLLPPLCCASRH